jgi:hypothetical protein
MSILPQYSHTGLLMKKINSIRRSVGLRLPAQVVDLRIRTRLVSNSIGLNGMSCSSTWAVRTAECVRACLFLSLSPSEIRVTIVDTDTKTSS